MDHSSPSPNSGTEISLTDGLEFCASAHAAPSAPGAYLLQIDLSEPIFVRIARKSCTELSAGRYFYCGSANGPGGLRSRLARQTGRSRMHDYITFIIILAGMAIGAGLFWVGLHLKSESRAKEARRARQFIALGIAFGFAAVLILVFEAMKLSSATCQQ